MESPTADHETLLEALHEHAQLIPGEECPRCHRKVPEEKNDDASRGERSVLSISEPKGLEGTLEPLMIAVVDKFQEQWPQEYASMRANIGLALVGERSWKFHVIHFALYALLTVPGLAPTEEGS